MADPTPVGNGLVVVDKPGGLTSHQVVARVRRLLGTRKVGHAGTLDPMATGLLLVGVNRATRLLGFLAGQDKTYLATIRLGQSTLTDDAEGEILATPGAAAVTDHDVASALPGFRGRISQRPSAVSAIKIDGQRAYARVRAGEEVELAAREVMITRFEILAQRRLRLGSLEVLDLDVVVDCSTGTYIRALARDLGETLGSGGHLTALRRTRIGAFTLADVGLSSQVVADRNDTSVSPKMLGMGEVARRTFDCLELTPDQARDVRHGRPLERELESNPTALLFDDELLALYRPAGPNRGVPVAVFS